MRVAERKKIETMKAEIILKAMCGLALLVLAGCSSTPPPDNPYTCPTDPSFTIPTYCKPGKDPLLTTSVGQGWVAPRAYYLYTEAPVDKDATEPPASAASPKTFIIDPTSGQLGDFSNPPVAFITGATATSANPAYNIFAQYDPAAPTVPVITMGIFAFDPDGTKGMGLDVSISWLSTDSQNNIVGNFQSLSNPSLLPNKAGKKIQWTASKVTDTSTRLADGTYTLTANGFDEKNNTFSVQFNVKVCQTPCQ